MTFKTILLTSIVLRIALIIYSEWHDARSLVKYTDVDYRVFTDAARFILQPTEDNRAQGPIASLLVPPIGDPYARDTYRYTPILALLLTPNILLHPSFGKYIFSACDIFNGLIIYSIILQCSNNPNNERETRSQRSRATLFTTIHLLNPMVFSISTRGSSESVLSLFVLLTLYTMLQRRWTLAAVFLGLSTHWKVYPIIYGASCLGAIGSRSGYGGMGFKGWLRALVNYQTIKFSLVSTGTFLALGTICYTIWGHPFISESYLYHLHRLDHRHNFSPYFYLTYLTYPNTNAQPTPAISTLDSLLRSPLTSFLPQLILSLGTGFLFSHDLVFAWFVQTATFVVFNKVCTSQYFLWYLLLVPLLLPNLRLSRAKASLCVGVWVGTQALWLSDAYHLEFLGQDVFLSLWVRGLVYVIGNCWILVEIMHSYQA